VKSGFPFYNTQKYQNGRSFVLSSAGKAGASGNAAAAEGAEAGTAEAASIFQASRLVK
jgi:hypothetical protein